jgi:hypothetical protein
MTYEGWANYQTWNVALWISNEEITYRQALLYVSLHDDPSYDGLMDSSLDEWDLITPDGVSWTDPTLDHEALDEFIRGLAE